MSAMFYLFAEELALEELLSYEYKSVCRNLKHAAIGSWSPEIHQGSLLLAT